MRIARDQYYDRGRFDLQHGFSGGHDFFSHCESLHRVARVRVRNVDESMIYHVSLTDV